MFSYYRTCSLTIECVQVDFRGDGTLNLKEFEEWFVTGGRGDARQAKAAFREVSAYMCLLICVSLYVSPYMCLLAWRCTPGEGCLS